MNGVHSQLLNGNKMQGPSQCYGGRGKEKNCGSKPGTEVVTNDAEPNDKGKPKSN